MRVSIVQKRFRGDVLPSELELVSTYGVSRGVIREVLELLRGEGLIERLQGAGTFVVAPERSPITIEEMGGLPNSIDEGQARVTWDILEQHAMPAPDLIAERLGLAPGEDVVYIERCTNLDGEPMSLGSSWLPLDVGLPMIDDQIDNRRSVYSLIEESLGHHVSQAELRVEATLADSTSAPVLRIAEGSPMLLMERLVYDINGRPVEYGFTRTRGDRMALTTVMRRHDRSTCPCCAAATRGALSTTPTRERRRTRARLQQPVHLLSSKTTGCEKGEAWD